MRTTLTLAIAGLALPAAAQTWSLVQPPQAPPAALGVAMAWHAPTNRLVLFGGAADEFAPLAPFGTTWAFDGTTWATVSTAASPFARVQHSMCSMGNAVLLFGGIDHQGSPLSDTWLFDGSNWQTGVFASAPSPRGLAALAGGVLFGGYVPGSGTVLGDGWYFQGLGTGWVQGSGGPGPRRGAAMAVTGNYNVVLHGGRDAQGNLLADTWRGSFGWFTAVAAAGGPAREEHAMVQDPRNGLVYLTGGRGPGGLAADLWRFDEVIERWLEVTPSTLPTPVRQAAAAFDSGRQRLVVFGGTGPTPGTALQEQWEYSQPVFAPQSIGTGCSLTLLFGLPRTRPTLRQDPLFAGRTASYQVGQIEPFLNDMAFLALGFDDTSWNGMPLPLDLGPMGLTGCTARLAPVAVVPMPGSYTGYASVHVPLNVEFLQVRLLAQAFVLNPGAVAFVTNATSCIVN